jgi:tetratricopeptide (TPR) repeat protein
MLRDKDGDLKDPLAKRLDSLASFRTYSPFSQLFARLIVAWSWEAGEEGRVLRDACLRFLDAELWYHQTLADLSEREAVSYEDLRSVADKRRINLTVLSEAVEAQPLFSSRANVVKHLLLAEVHYHLRETPTTLSELEAAIAGGGAHPLVHFALGYNRLDHAREQLAMAQTALPREAERLEREFRRGCLSAADAFRDGLTGQAFDAQLHHWIGRALAAAGMAEEAEAALETAARIDPSILDRRPMVDDPEEGMALAPTSAEAPLAEPEPGIGPITDDEVRRAAELLKRRWRRDEVLGIDA